MKIDTLASRFYKGEVVVIHEGHYYHGGVEVSKEEAAELVASGAHYGGIERSFFEAPKKEETCAET